MARFIDRECIIRLSVRRALRVVAVCAALGILAAAVVYWQRAPILTWIGHQLVHADPLERADAILVLAGGSPERELEAADLFRAGYASTVILTRESEHPGVALLQARGIQSPSDLDERLRYFQALGVPRTAIVVLDGVAESTAWESEIARRWSDAHAVRRLIVVTSAFHTGRARYTFLGAFEGSRTELLFRPASADAFRPGDWWRNRVTLRNGLIEWQKQLIYRLRY